MTIRAAVERFLKSCAAGGKSPETCRHYQGRLRSLVDLYGDKEWTDLVKIDWLEWLQAANKGRSASTRRANATVLLIFHGFSVQWLELPEKLKRKDIERPAAGRRELTLSEAQTRALIDQLSPNAALLYRALRLTGCRPSELVGATVEQLQVRDEVRVLVLAKHKTAKSTGRDKVIPLGAGVAPLIDEALAGRTSGLIFVRAAGIPWTVPQISREFRRARIKAGIPAGIVLYCARHEFASAVVKDRGIHEACKLLGHASIQTTQRYSHSNIGDLAAVQSHAIADITASGITPEASPVSRGPTPPAASTDPPTARPAE